MKSLKTYAFESVREWQDDFLSLFPHRFDYIFALFPNLGETPSWQTERRHPLSDRLIRQAAYLYGVRFGAETNYCLLDIDAGSAYHPRQDPFAIARIVAALEPLGLVSYVPCTSSYSGGLHLYFPFQHRQSSWQLAIVLACLLENAGFKLQPGQLEIFPNPKPYATDGSISLFNAHRLPLQIGSYVLNDSWQPIWSDSQTFVDRWKFAQCRNDIDTQTLKQTIKQAKRKQFGISGKAEKFINDLNAEIELGWTGLGQTNRLLGRITMRAYIFHHILSGGEPLAGQALVSEIVETARSLPGYTEWCRHQHEIEHRAMEWARCIENSHYFHFGEQVKQSTLDIKDPQLTTAIEQSPTWNQRQSAATRDRIRVAIADLLEKECLPARPTARFKALLQYGIGGASLYRHRDLWHPDCLQLHTSLDDLEFSDCSQNESVENPPNPPIVTAESQLDGVTDASNWLNPASLFAVSGGNFRQDGMLSDRTPEQPQSEDGNELAQPAGVDAVKQALKAIVASKPTMQETTQRAQAEYQQAQQEAAEQRQIARMQQFLDSGDPILIAEALSWIAINSV